MGRGWQSLLVISWVTLLALAWVLAYRIMVAAPPLPGASVSDQAALLFGASSVAMFAVSFFIGIVALLGWGAVKEHIRDEVRLSTEERLTRLEKEVRGRMLNALGFVIGELCTNPDELRPNDPDRLAIAVKHCQASYAILRDISENTKFVALNNLVYYMAILGNNDEKREFLREQARLLRAKGEEHGVARLLLTYCRVVVAYWKNRKEIEEALAIVRALRREGLDEREAREAKLYEKSLESLLESQAPPLRPANPL